MVVLIGIHLFMAIGFLARLGRIDKDLTNECRQALGQSLTKEKLQDEAKYINSKQRQAFERPYGLAWLLQLVMELDEWAQEEKESFIFQY
jgi:hypothetical protein